jgi:hypothetical protein
MQQRGHAPRLCGMMQLQAAISSLLVGPATVPNELYELQSMTARAHEYAPVVSNSHGNYLYEKPPKLSRLNYVIIH